MSASSSIKYGSLPPSSKTVFFNIAPALAATDLPAGTLPVKVTARINGCSITLSILEDLTKIDLNKLSGNPASLKISSIAKAQPDTFEECFRIPAFPAIKPGAANLKTCHSGKFHGITASTTPKGL